jgi:hypothetical protein
MCTTSFDIRKFFFGPTVSIYVFYMDLREKKNSVYFRMRY